MNKNKRNERPAGRARMARAFAFALAFVIASGAAVAESDAIRVGTYNIRNSVCDKGTPNAWSERKDDLVDFIRNLNLDVFGLQEVCPDQDVYIHERMGDYEFVGEHRDADRKSGESSPVCYRKSRFEALDKGTFWLSETPDVAGSKSWNTAYTRVCSYLILKDKANGKKFCFANTHTDHVSELAREKGMLLIVERMKKFGEGAPIVFTGDHNCRENENPALEVSKILKNALYETKTPPQGPWRTYEGWKWLDRETSVAEALAYPLAVRNDGGEQFGLRIDYIYASPDVTVLDYRTVNDSRPGKQLYPSDHFPVVATIKFH